MNATSFISPSSWSPNFNVISKAHSAHHYERMYLTHVSRPSIITPQLLILGHIAHGWKIIRPLLLNIEQDEHGSFFISDEQFLVYGYGQTQEAARCDYIRSLIEYYHILASNNDIPTQVLFSALQSYLSPSL